MERVESKNGNHYICGNCRGYLYKGSLPIGCYENGFKFGDLPEEFQDLNRLDKSLLALRTPFMKIGHTKNKEHKKLY